jgi:hypothetical protein
MTKMPNQGTGGKKTPRPCRVFRPLRAIRLNCVDCSGSTKTVLWCPCDGIHSPRCHLWPYRFGCRPETVAERFGPLLVTPGSMPGSEVSEDDLPAGLESAAAYLAERQQTGNGNGGPGR